MFEKPPPPRLDLIRPADLDDAQRALYAAITEKKLPKGTVD